jgi:transcriptional antiterminator NusG
MESFEKSWYVLHTYSGYENRVKANIESRAQSMGMGDFIFRVVVPEETEVEVKNGKEKEIVHKTFPGYVLVEMMMTDESWYVVRNTPGVTGFLGSHGGGSKPVPLLPEEVDDMLARMNIVERKVEHLDIAVGDLVDVVAGSFAGQEGAAVTDVDEEHQEVTVLINIFGRDTPTQISFSDIKPVK